MNEEDFKRRTKRFALDVIELVGSLPKDRSADVIARQLLRSSTSVGANYRSATRAQSVAHMISKLSIVEEEADESMYWLELLFESGLVPPGHQAARRLQREASELCALTVASKRTLKRRIPAPTENRKSKIGNAAPIDNRQSPGVES